MKNGPGEYRLGHLVEKRFTLRCIMLILKAYEDLPRR